VTFGNGLILELEGEVDCPFPKRAVIIMKYFSGLKTFSSPYEPFIVGNSLRYVLAEAPYMTVRGIIQPENQEG